MYELDMHELTFIQWPDPSHARLQAHTYYLVHNEKYTLWF